jgi:hypothetical protein
MKPPRPSRTDWLSYDEAKIQIGLLNIKNQDDWNKRVKSKDWPKNIPKTPWVLYKDQWVGLRAFLGTPGRDCWHLAAAFQTRDLISETLPADSQLGDDKSTQRGSARKNRPR